MVKGIEPSIIEIIEKMVREGKSEEQIIKHLKALGIKPTQAKKLLLLGEADTFNILRRDLGRIVAEEVKKQKDEIKKDLLGFSKKEIEKIREESVVQGKKLVKEFKKEVSYDLENFKDLALSKQNQFQQKMQEQFSSLLKTITHLRNATETLKDKQYVMENDIKEAKIKGIGVKNKIVSQFLLAFGVIICIVAIYLFIAKFEVAVTVDSMIMTIALVIMGITMLFVATLV